MFNIHRIQYIPGSAQGALHIQAPDTARNLDNNISYSSQDSCKSDDTAFISKMMKLRDSMSCPNSVMKPG